MEKETRLGEVTFVISKLYIRGKTDSCGRVTRGRKRPGTRRGLPRKVPTTYTDGRVPGDNRVPSETSGLGSRPDETSPSQRRGIVLPGFSQDGRRGDGVPSFRSF